MGKPSPIRETTSSPVNNGKTIADAGEIPPRTDTRLLLTILKYWKILHPIRGCRALNCLIRDTVPVAPWLSKFPPLVGVPQVQGRLHVGIALVPR